MEAGLASARSSTVQLTGNSYAVWASTLYNCLVTDNEGGSSGVFYNCTVVGNNGGVSGTFFNSILYYNSGSNYSAGATLNYCLTTPLPTNGVGNITGPPLFMDMASGDYRLWEGSPCIDAGMNLMGLAIVPYGPIRTVEILRFCRTPTTPLTSLATPASSTAMVTESWLGTLGLTSSTASNPQDYRHPSTHYKRLDVECHRTHEQMG